MFSAPPLFSPVPGGVGPMTIAALLINTYKAFLNKSPLSPEGGKKEDYGEDGVFKIL